MSSHVLRPTAGRRERLATSLADVPPLPCMCTRVQNQAAGIRERVPARRTGKRFVSRMDSHVLSQAAGMGERLGAYLTLDALGRRATSTHVVHLVFAVASLALLPTPTCATATHSRNVQLSPAPVGWDQLE